MFLQKRLFPCKTILWEITWGWLKAGIFLAGAILRSLAFTFCHGDKNVPHLGEWMQKTRRWGIPSLPHPGRRPSTLVERSQCSLWCISLDKAEMLSYGPKNVLDSAFYPALRRKIVLIFIWVIFTLTYPDIHLKHLCSFPNLFAFKVCTHISWDNRSDLCTWIYSFWGITTSILIRWHVNDESFLEFFFASTEIFIVKIQR